MTFTFIFLCPATSAIPPDACNYQKRVCECDSRESECHFSLIVEDLISFTSYKLDRSASGQLSRRHNAASSRYNFSSQGELIPFERDATLDVDNCVIFDEAFHENLCSIPMTVDSIPGGGPFIGVNGLLPGPTLVVTEGQTVIIEVTNALINKEVSIHWHGQFQNNTPWMDGVDHITQCPIPTYARFRYIFKASPSGTMWYHSHVGTQRTEGLFGALIVRDKGTVFNDAQSRLRSLIEPGSSFQIVDNPNHTMTFLDWQDVDAVEITIMTINRERTNDSMERRGPDGTIISRLPFHAGLINGFGKVMEVNYNRSRLSIFNVLPYNENDPVYYRFRLVGSQRQELFRFSISEHRLIVIAADGFLTRPMEVDYIFIHAGERYDFLLRPKTEEETREQPNFLISADTLDSDTDNVTRRAEAILHYGDMSGNPTSTEYESIINNHIPRTCNSTSRCKALNCPFQFYAPNFFIDCVPVTELQLLIPTPPAYLPSNNINYVRNEHFFDFSFEGPSGSAAINGRNLAFPAGSLLTDIDSTLNLDCKPGYVNCSADTSQCICQHILNVTDTWATTQFVLSNLADPVGDKAAHPIHLHGHSFQVVGIYYGTYNDSTGELIANNDNINCNISNTMTVDPSCTDPRWAGPPVDGTINDTTVRKDTIIVPPGGYVVLRFIANNWGFWYMHCHIEPHFLEGMAAVINEGYELQNVPPDNLIPFQCGNFNWTVEQFDSVLNMPMERRFASCTTSLCSPTPEPSASDTTELPTAQPSSK